MSGFDILVAISEVAVAFAGFASLVSILGQRRSVDDARVLGVRMRAMLLASLLVVAFALVPLVLVEFGGSTATVWRMSSLGLLAATVAYLVWLGATFRWLRRTVEARPFQRFVILPVLYSTFTLLVGSIAANLIVAGAALYVTALALLLFQSGFAFSLIVFSFLPRVRDDLRSAPPGEAGGRHE